MKSTWCSSAPAIPVSDEPDETIRKRSIEESKYINFFQFSCNVKTLFYWERKGDLYTTHVATISD